MALKELDESAIDATEISLKKLFEDYLFRIPRYQRPFSWQEENFEDLIDDLWDAYQKNKDERSSEDIENYSSYFLGSIILKPSSEDGSDRFEIIDGQQRLISLSILVAVLRDLIIEGESGPENEGDLQKFIYKQKGRYEGPAQPRIKLREKEEDFYDNHILTSEATTDLEDMDRKNLTKPREPKENMLESIDVFLDGLEDKDFREVDNFAEYILKRITIVRIMAGSFNSAFRLFNVINTRGMELTNADLLKSYNIGNIKEDDRDLYGQKWEDIEKEIGNEGIQKLIGFIRHIELKTKASKSVYIEYKKNLFENNPELRGKEFVRYLEGIAEIYEEKILDKNIDADEPEDIYFHNLISIMKNFFPSDTWMATLIMFVNEFGDGPYVLDFLKKLEKKIAVDWISGRTSSERLTQVYDVMEKIEDSEEPGEVTNSELLNEDVEKREDKFKDTLDVENFYRKGNYRMAKYVLLRIDLEKHGNTDRRASYGEGISIEHILPQTPTDDYWQDRFEDEMFRRKWNDKLGNLVPLNGRKNSSAQNFPYSKKVEKYFEETSDLALVNELKDNYNDWTPEKLKNRHEELKEETVNLWF